MAQSLTERVRDLTNGYAVLKDRDERRQQDFDRLTGFVETLRVELAAREAEVAVLKARQDDQTKRFDAWALVTVLVGALLSLASGLIVTLARR